MTTAQSDIPKMHMIYFSTVRGMSNPDGAKEMVYYGKVFRVPKGIVAKKKGWALGSIENREIEDLEQRFINAPCVKDGNPAISEAMERYEVFDTDTGDILVMYRVPYKSSDEQPPPPTTKLPLLSRHARRAAAKQGTLPGQMLPLPPNISQKACELVGSLLRVLGKTHYKAFKLPESLVAEQRALACITIAAHELAAIPPSTQRQAIITQMGVFLNELILQADNEQPLPSGISEEDFEQGAEEGWVTRIVLGPDDTDKLN